MYRSCTVLYSVVLNCVIHVLVLWYRGLSFTEDNNRDRKY